MSVPSWQDSILNYTWFDEKYEPAVKSQFRRFQIWGWNSCEWDLFRRWGAQFGLLFFMCTVFILTFDFSSPVFWGSGREGKKNWAPVPAVWGTFTSVWSSWKTVWLRVKWWGRGTLYAEHVFWGRGEGGGLGCGGSDRLILDTSHRRSLFATKINKWCFTLWPWHLHLKNHKAKEKLWKLKYFTIQKYNLLKIL